MFTSIEFIETEKNCSHIYHSVISVMWEWKPKCCYVVFLVRRSLWTKKINSKTVNCNIFPGFAFWQMHNLQCVISHFLTNLININLLVSKNVLVLLFDFGCPFANSKYNDTNKIWRHENLSLTLNRNNDNCTSRTLIVLKWHDIMFHVGFRVIIQVTGIRNEVTGLSKKTVSLL